MALASSFPCLPSVQFLFEQKVSKRSKKKNTVSFGLDWRPMIDDSEQFASLFHDAVRSIDAGDLASLIQLFAERPSLATTRLGSSPEWLRKEVGGALDGFFRDPYLLWFVTEDPIRNSRLPANVVELAQTIIVVAKREDPDVLSEQTDYALRLVCWSWIARDCGVQIPLIDAFLEAGASLDGWAVYEGRYGSHADSAIYNRNDVAAEHLLAKGASVTLTTALCLGRWDEAERLAASASEEDKQAAFVQAALNGKAEALRRMLALGMAPTTISARNQSHGTALHHAVWSRSLEAVRVLVEAGADLERCDSLYGGTPLGWARHGAREAGDSKRADEYDRIAEYLLSSSVAT